MKNIEISLIEEVCLYNNVRARPGERPLYGLTGNIKDIASKVHIRVYNNVHKLGHVVPSLYIDNKVTNNNKSKGEHKHETYN